MSEDAKTYEIEVFRVGTASRGITTKEVDEAIASYDAEKAGAPLVFGHPTSDKPAHGWIAALRREGDKLLATLKDVSSEAIEKVKAKAFRNRSIAFWHPDHSANPAAGKWGIRHLGLLGAAQPGIPNMTPLTFSADDARIESTEAPEAAVIFTEEATETVVISEKGDKVSDKTETVDKAEFDAAVAERDRLQGIVAAAATRAETDRKAANVKFVDELIEKGLWTPGRKVLLAETLNQLPVEEVQFDADHKGSLADEWRKIFSGLDPVITFETLSPRGEAEERGEKTAGDIVVEANAMVKAAADKGQTMTFDAAVEAIEAKGAK